jgi:hypothetical protein
MAFALAVTAVLYLSLGSFSAAIPGLVLGLVVAVGCTWLLIRIQPAEAGVTLGLVSAAFVGSTLLLAGMLTLANVMTRSMLGNTKTQLVESPFGPGLAWDAPPPAKPNDGRRKGGEPVIVADAGQSPAPGEPASAPTPPASPTPTAPQTPLVAVPATPTPTPGAASPTPEPVAKAPAGDTGDKPPADPADPAPKPPRPEPNLFPDSKLFGPGAKPAANLPKPPTEDEDPDPMPPATPEPPPRPAGPPAPPAQVPPEYAAASGDPVAFSILGAKVPLIATVRATQTIGTFERVVPALIPANVVLVVKHGGRADADLLESWDLSSLKRLASTEVKRDVAEMVGVVNGVPSYAASPDGATWARITTFPTLCLEITPLAGNNAPLRLPLKDPAGEATVLGYLAPDRVLVRWRSGESVRLDVWDIKSKSQSGRIVLPPHPPSIANGVVSPDGKVFAVVSAQGTRATGSRPTLWLFDLSAHQTPRSVPIIAVDAQRAVKPTGMAFSPDGNRIGLLYEQNGNTVVLGYRQTPTALTATEPLAAPAGKVAPMADEAMAVGRLSSVAGGKGWLVGGNVVLDADSGMVLGDFGIEIPCAHLSNGGEALYLSGDPGQRRLTLVKMKDEGKKPAAAPATRPR